MKIKLISLVLVLIMLCSLVLTSCGEEAAGGGNTDKPATGTTPGGEDDGGDTKDEPKEYKAFSIVLESFKFINSDGGENEICDAKLVFELCEDGTLICEGSGTVYPSVIGKDPEINVTSSGDFDEGEERMGFPCKLALSGGKAYIVTSDADGKENVDVFSGEMLLEAIREGTGIDLMMLAELFGSTSDALSLWFAEDLIPALGSLNSSVLIGKIEEYRAGLWSTFIIEDGTEGDSKKYKVNLDVISEYNKLLSENSAKAAYELVFGADTFVDFKAAVAGALAISVNDLVQSLEKNGAKRESLFLALDKLASILLGKEGATIEELLRIDGDIEEMLSDPETLGYTFSDLLKLIFGIENDSDLSNLLANFYAELSKKTLYEYLGEVLDVPELQGAIPEILDVALSGLEISFTLSKSGELSALDISGSFAEGENPIGAALEKFRFVFADGALDIGIVTGGEDGFEFSSRISFHASEESLTNGEVYRYVLEKAKEIPAEDELISDAKKHLGERFGDKVSFAFGEDGKTLYALIISEESFGEININEENCYYQRRETKINLSGFTRLNLQKEAEGEIIISGEVIIEDSLASYQIGVSLSAPGAYSYDTEDATPENRISVESVAEPYRHFIFYKLGDGSGNIVLFL